MIWNNNILSDKSREIDEMEEEFQLMYLASTIVDGTFNFFKIERKTSKVGKPPFNLKDMIKLIFYGYMNKITSTVELAYNAKYNHLYNWISHGIEPSDRTIRDYCKYFQPIYQLIMSFILIVANRIGLTDFEHIAIDGTIKGAYNSPFNIIKEKDISLLIKHYMVEELSKEEIKKLRRTARKFLEDKSKSDEEKVDILFYWRHLLDYSGQVSLALNDYDARLMKTKDNGQKYPKFSFNIQLGTDTKSKLICGVNAVQNPTDHYQIPALMNQILVNLQINRENSGNLPDNPFAIDYFVFDEYKNVFICPNNEELTLDGAYNAPQEKGGGNKIKLVYSNYQACKNCKYKGKCYTSNHRTITRYVHEVTYKVERLMSTKDGIKDYKLRSKTVEAHNGTFKRIYNYDCLPIIGLKRVQNLMFTIVASYNLIRLFNLIKVNKMDLHSVISSIKFISLT